MRNEARNSDRILSAVHIGLDGMIESMKNKPLKLILECISIIALIALAPVVLLNWFGVFATIHEKIRRDTLINEFNANLTVRDFYISILPNSSSPYWLNITSGDGISSRYRYINTVNGPYNALIHDAWVIITTYSLDANSTLQVWVLDGSKVIAYSGVCNTYKFSNFTWKGF